MKVCLFQKVTGVILLNEIPQDSAVVKRNLKWAWANEIIEDAAKTGLDGTFHLPPIFRRMILGAFLPHEPLISQSILIESKGVTYRALLADKRDYANSSPLELVCELANQEVRSTLGFGICIPKE